MAMANATESWKKVVRPAVAIAKRSGGMSRSAAPTSCEKPVPADTPTRTVATSRRASEASVETVATSHSSPAMPQADPAVRREALPMRSARRPACGATRNETKGPTEYARPVSSADHPQTSWMKVGSGTSRAKNPIAKNSEPRLPSTNERMRSSRRSNRGAGWCRLRHAKAATSSAPAAKQATVAAAVHPHASPWTIPRMIAPTPTDARGTPIRSTRAAGAPAGPSGP